MTLFSSAWTNSVYPGKGTKNCIELGEEVGRGSSLGLSDVLEGLLDPDPTSRAPIMHREHKNKKKSGLLSVLPSFWAPAFLFVNFRGRAGERAAALGSSGAKWARASLTPHGSEIVVSAQI